MYFNCLFLVQRHARLVHQDRCADPHAAVQIHNIVIDETDAAERDIRPDRLRRIGPVDTRSIVVKH